MYYETYKDWLAANAPSTPEELEQARRLHEKYPNRFRYIAQIFPERGEEIWNRAESRIKDDAAAKILSDKIVYRPIKNQGRELTAEGHAVAFTLARISHKETIEAAKRACEKAAAQGMDFGDFKRDFLKLMSEDGNWTFVSGEGGQPTLMISESRARIIYDTNMRSSMAAAKEMRSEALSEFFPFWQYLESVSDDKRPEHLKFVGLCLPKTHGFWRAHYPPNGYQCKCSVRDISKREFKRLKGDGKIRDQVDDLALEGISSRMGDKSEAPFLSNPGMMLRELADYAAEGTNPTVEERFRGMGAQDAFDGLIDEYVYRRIKRPRAREIFGDGVPRMTMRRRAYDEAKRRTQGLLNPQAHVYAATATADQTLALKTADGVWVVSRQCGDGPALIFYGPDGPIFKACPLFAKGSALGLRARKGALTARDLERIAEFCGKVKPEEP